MGGNGISPEELDEAKHKGVEEAKHEGHSKLFIGLMIGFLVSLLVGAVAAWITYQSVRDAATEGVNLAERVLVECKTTLPVDRSKALQDLCENADDVVEEAPPAVNAVEIQDPEIQEPEIQDPEVQDPEPGDPEVQDPETQDRETQDEETQDPEIQDPEIQDPENQEPEEQEPEIQEPENQEPDEQPDSFTFNNGTAVWHCTKNQNSTPRNPSYTCTQQ